MLKRLVLVALVAVFVFAGWPAVSSADWRPVPPQGKITDSRGNLLKHKIANPDYSRSSFKSSVAVSKARSGKARWKENAKRRNPVARASYAVNYAWEWAGFGFTPQACGPVTNRLQVAPDCSSSTVGGTINNAGQGVLGGTACWYNGPFGYSCTGTQFCCVSIASTADAAWPIHKHTAEGALANFGHNGESGAVGQACVDYLGTRYRPGAIGRAHFWQGTNNSYPKAGGGVDAYVVVMDLASQRYCLFQAQISTNGTVDLTYGITFHGAAWYGTGPRF